MTPQYHKERAHALRLKALYHHTTARYLLLDESMSPEQRQALCDWNTAQAMDLTDMADLEEAKATRSAA